MGLVVILVLFATGSIPFGTVSPTDSPSGVQDVPVERLKEQSEAMAIISTTVAEPDVIQAQSQQDGPSLLRSHCARCHSTQWLEQIKESRSEWEGNLSQMERMDVRLSDTEKAILLDYLASNNVP